MSFLILPPAVSTLEARTRALGASSLPKTQNFWFEDIPQIPATLRALPFQILTDYVGEPHEFLLDGKIFKRFVPSEASSTLEVVLNPRIYSCELVHPRTGTTSQITFQVSVRELIWWAWIQQLLGPLQRLENLEQRFNSPLHLAVFEASYPQEILGLQSSQWSVRSFAQAGHLKNVAGSTNSFVGGLLGTPVSPLNLNWELRDRRADFSQAQYPFVDSTVSRRSAFLSQASGVVDSSWNHGVLGHQKAPIENQNSNATSTLRVRLHTGGLPLDPTRLHITGFSGGDRYFSLTLDPKFRSAISIPSATTAGDGSFRGVSTQGNHAQGSGDITLRVVGGTLTLKRYSSISVQGHSLPLMCLSDLDLEDGESGSVLVSALQNAIPDGALVSLRSLEAEFPLLQVATPQAFGSTSLEVLPWSSGLIHAGSKIVFNGDPVMYTVEEPLVLEAGVLTNLPLLPTLKAAKDPTQVGQPLLVYKQYLDEDTFELFTTPWFLAGDLTIYCFADGFAKLEQGLTIFPGKNIVDFHLIPQ